MHKKQTLKNMIKNTCLPKGIKSKPLALLGAAILMGTLCFAQNIAPQAVTTSGIKFTQANGSLNFTVGELVVKNQTDANGNTLGSGFTNAATGSTTVLSLNTPDKDVLNVSVYPNPTTDLLTVDVAATTLSQLVIDFSWPHFSRNSKLY